MHGGLCALPVSSIKGFLGLYKGALFSSVGEDLFVGFWRGPVRVRLASINPFEGIRLG